MSNTDATAGADTKLPKEIWVLVVRGVHRRSRLRDRGRRRCRSSRAASGWASPRPARVISVFALMRLLFAPMSGRLVQKLGERPTYMSGLLITAASMGACTVASEYWQLLVFRALGGSDRRCSRCPRSAC